MLTIPAGSAVASAIQVQDDDYFSSLSEDEASAVTSEPAPQGSAHFETAAAIGGSGKAKVVSYARRYADESNPSWPTYRNDCTNFVSQCMLAGGWTMDYEASIKGWFYRNNKKLYQGGRSRSWSLAEEFHQMAPARGLVWDTRDRYALRGGDLLQIQRNGDNVMTHSLVCTGYDSRVREPIFCCHTVNSKDYPLSHFIGGFPNSTWYPMGVY